MLFSLHITWAKQHQPRYATHLFPSSHTAINTTRLFDERRLATDLFAFAQSSIVSSCYSFLASYRCWYTVYRSGRQFTYLQLILRRVCFACILAILAPYTCKCARFKQQSTTKTMLNIFLLAPFTRELIHPNANRSLCTSSLWRLHIFTLSSIYSHLISVRSISSRCTIILFALFVCH